VPRIPGWTVHTYAYVPASANVWRYVAPGSMTREKKPPPLALWVTVLELRHVSGTGCRRP
jgi:hypothetical protein